MAQKYQEEPCGFCGVTCSCHPDAGNSLAYCGDCGRVTCPDHRVGDEADRCVDCAAGFYRAALATCANCATVAPATYYPATDAEYCAACLAAVIAQDAAAFGSAETLIGEFITIPAWGVTGCVIDQRPATLGSDAAIDVLVQAHHDDPAPRWYRCEPSEFEVV